MNTDSVKKVRNGNIELLRIISMLMVVMLHALGKSYLLPNLGILNIFEGMDKGGEMVALTKQASVNGVIAWIFESLSISAVNIFVLISGYFLIDSNFKVKRLISLVLQILFYSVGVFAVCMVFKIPTGEPVDTYFILRNIFPLHMNVYWFMTAYVVVYMLLPVLSAGVKNISQKQFFTMLLALLIYECFFKSFLPVRFSGDGQGYSVFWFILMFLIGAYFKMYGFKYLTSSGKGLALYFCASLLVFLENGALNVVTTLTGRLKDISSVSTEYNHIFVLLAAVGIFAAFINRKPMGEKMTKVVCTISPYALGVYLFHESLAIRFTWTKYAGLNGSLEDSTGKFVLRILVSVVCVYVLGTVIDFIRSKIFRLFKLS